MSISKRRKSLFRILGGFALLILLSCAGYIIINQSVTIDYMQDGYKRAEEDLAAIVCIFNDTNFSKNQIEKCVRQYPSYEHTDFLCDTVTLQRYQLIFKNNKLVKIGEIE